MTYRTSPDIPNLPTLDDVIQRPHDLLARSLAIQSMDLQYVDVRAQTGDTGIDGVEDVLPREADAVDETAVVGTRGRDRGHAAFVVDAEVAFG